MRFDESPKELLFRRMVVKSRESVGKEGGLILQAAAAGKTEGPGARRACSGGQVLGLAGPKALLRPKGCRGQGLEKGGSKENLWLLLTKTLTAEGRHPVDRSSLVSREKRKRVLRGIHRLNDQSYELRVGEVSLLVEKIANLRRKKTPGHGENSICSSACSAVLPSRGVKGGTVGFRGEKAQPHEAANKGAKQRFPSKKGTGGKVKSSSMALGRYENDLYRSTRKKNIRDPGAGTGQRPLRVEKKQA